METNTRSSWLMGGLLTAILFGFFLYVNRQMPTTELLMASPYFVVLYWLTFSAGQSALLNQVDSRIRANRLSVLFFPVALVGVLFSYLWLHGHSPFSGTAALFPFYLLMPVLYYLAFTQKAGAVGWDDFVVLILFIIPATEMSFEAKTNLPFNGSGFGSVLRFVIMLAGVYSFSLVRGIPDIGFYPVFRLRSLFTATWVWLAFFGFTLGVGYAGNFMRLAGHEAYTLDLFVAITQKLINIFFATALFEELFFRGLLQNFLSRKIAVDGQWQRYWRWGLGLLVVASGVVGYFLKANVLWLPMITAALMFGAAWVLEKKQGDKPGSYTALAMVSVFFGLVHAHSGSLIFVVLAGIAGWAYGYAYLKTKNVFYAALVHTLVNGSEFIFGLELVK